MKEKNLNHAKNTFYKLQCAWFRNRGCRSFRKRFWTFGGWKERANNKSNLKKKRQRSRKNLGFMYTRRNSYVFNGIPRTRAHVKRASTFRRYRDFGTFRARMRGGEGVCAIMGLEHCRSFHSVYWRTISFRRLLSRRIVIPCNARSYLITTRTADRSCGGGRGGGRKKRAKHAPYDRYRRRRRTAFKNAWGRFASTECEGRIGRFGFRSPTAIALAAGTETCRRRAAAGLSMNTKLRPDTG